MPLAAISRNDFVAAHTLVSELFELMGSTHALGLRDLLESFHK
jgi:hypothetical protein